MFTLYIGIQNLCALFQTNCANVAENFLYCVGDISTTLCPTVQKFTAEPFVTKCVLLYLLQHFITNYLPICPLC
jgi:hypothetical protein